ncbi:MAG: hypothetical protein AAFU79_26145, partial [Myxococcota bacterium]
GDGGASWRELTTVAPAPASVIAVSPTDPLQVHFGAGFGVYATTDGGTTAERLNPGVSQTPRLGVRNGTVRAMLIRGDGRLLVGSDGFGVMYRTP